MRISIYKMYHYFVNQNHTLLAVVILSFDWNLSLFSLVSQKFEAEAGCFDFAELMKGTKRLDRLQTGTTVQRSDVLRHGETRFRQN